MLNPQSGHQRQYWSEIYIPHLSPDPGPEEAVGSSSLL